MNRIVPLLVVLVLLAGAARAQIPSESTKPTDQPSPQPQPTGDVLPLQPAGSETDIESDVYVGDKAPDFKLDGAGGRTVRLSDLQGQWAVLVFDVSRAKLGALKSVEPDLRKLGARLYGVTKEGWEALETYSDREQIPFPLLSDLTGQISQLYGMYDLDADEIVPGLVLLDPKGVVRMIIDGQSLHGVEVLLLARHAIAGA